MSLEDVTLDGRPDYLAQEGEASVMMGARHGFYDALALFGAVSPMELSRLTCTARWFTAAWLHAQAERGYLAQDTGTGRYRNWCPI